MPRGSSVLGAAILLLSPMLGAAARADDGAPGVVVEQNLFHPSRSVPPPPPPPAPAAPAAQPAPPPPPPPKFELSGIVKVDRQAPMALLQEPQLTQGRPRIVNLGELVGAYKLVAVEDDRVRLEANGRSVTVLLHDPAKRPKAVAAVAPSVPAPPQPRALPPPLASPRDRPVAPRLENPELAEPAAASRTPPAADPQNAEMKPGAILNAFERAFGALTGQGRLPLFPSPAQPDQGRGQ